MIRVSFYLNSPQSKQSPVYISITKDNERLRFPSDLTFLTSHVSKRKKKGKSFLIKGMTHYFNYNKQIEEIEEELVNYSIEFDLKKEKYTLAQIKEKYCLKRKSVVIEDFYFFDCFDQYFEIKKGQWKEGTQKHFKTLKSHLLAFEKEVLKEKIQIKNFDDTLFIQFRDAYLVKFKKLGNSTSNNYLKKLKEFCKYAVKKEWITTKVYFDDFRRLAEAETFNIALKKSEVDAILNLDLTDNLKLARVRDLFLLEIYTGQRFSDIPQIIDLSKDVEESIKLYQKKTFGKAFIPIHEKLKQHLKKINNKNYTDITSISLQKFNKYLKEIAALVGMNKVHHWNVLIGIDSISKKDFRYNLVSSHSGRRTFCTLALKKGVSSDKIMKVTGHKSYEDFKKYIKIDEEDLNEAFDGIFD
jgi:integrase